MKMAKGETGGALGWFPRKLAELKDLFAQVSQKVAQKVEDAEEAGPRVRVVEFILEIEIARRK